MRKTFILLCFLMLAGCTTPSVEPDLAENALILYFYLLNQGDYQSASAYYGGDYKTLIEMNPAVNPSDHALLWENACLNNGFMCLQVSRATFLGLRGGIYSFEVEFMQADGTQFSRGACCGEDPASVIPQTTFLYGVIEPKKGEFLVLELPVYVP
jgi:hypothetical protein